MSLLAAITLILPVAVGSGALAHAQSSAPVGVDAHAAGLGIKVGDGRLHPFVDVDTHWVTNPGRLPNGTTSDLLSTGRLGCDLLLPSTTLDLKGQGDVAYNQYWGLQTADTKGFSTLLGHAGLTGIFNKEGALVLTLDQDFVRSADPASQSVTTRLLHNMETARLTADMMPGGGALVVTAGYGFFYDRYDRANPNLPGGLLDNWRHMPEARLAWKFLPKTALFAEAGAQFTQFNPTLFGGVRPNRDSTIVTAHAGLTGMVTPRITTTLKGGYGLLLVGGIAAQTPMGQLEVTYKGSETSTLTVGATRTLVPTSFFTYLTQNRAYVRYEQRFTTRTQLTINPQANLLSFGPAAGINRTDMQVVVDVTLAQQLADWFVLSLVDHMDLRTSDYATPLGNAGYRFNDVLVRVDLRY